MVYSWTKPNDVLIKTQANKTKEKPFSNDYHSPIAELHNFYGPIPLKHRTLQRTVSSCLKPEYYENEEAQCPTSS